MHRRTGPVTAIGGLAAIVAASLSTGAAPATAEPATATFVFTGTPQSWTVPAGVTEIAATACGAQGGDSASATTDGPGPSALGGLGGCATATLPVTPGETLVILAGGQGDASASASGDINGVTTSRTTVRGFNGGGAGGLAEASVTRVDDCQEAFAGAAAAGGGGGGASDIRQDGGDPADRVLVGGGGGGGGSAAAIQSNTDDQVCPVTVAPASAEPGSDDDQAPAPDAVVRAELSSFVMGGAGGSGGGTVGADGADGSGSPTSGAGGGGQAAAGSGGQLVGVDGSGEKGGPGHSVSTSSSSVDPVTASASATAGGGGGGGWFGGGGGAQGPLGSSEKASGGGGAGSGFGPVGVAFEEGVRAGAGLVTITYELADVVGVVAGRPSFTG